MAQVWHGFFKATKILDTKRDGTVNTTFYHSKHQSREEGKGKGRSLGPGHQVEEVGGTRILCIYTKACVCNFCRVLIQGNFEVSLEKGVL